MEEITLKLSKEEIQFIINVLVELPFKQVGMLVPKLKQQAEDCLKKKS